MAPRNFSEDGAYGAASSGETPNASGWGAPKGAMAGFMPQNNPSTPGMNDMGMAAMAAPMQRDVDLNMFNGQQTSNDVGNPWASFSNNAAFSYAEGGAIDEDSGEVPTNGLARSIQQALGSVGAAMSYGYRKHGLDRGADAGENGDGGSSGYSNFRQSDNVEDRTGENSTMQSVMQPIYKTMGNGYSLYNRATGHGINPDDENDQLSRDAGVRDIGGKAQPRAAIETEDDEEAA